MGRELIAGQLIRGKYEIVSKSGVGSLGDDMYLGLHKDMDREIMIRILPVSMTNDKEITNRFLQGVRLTASLQHPNILPAYDAGEENGNFFFVTAFEKGFFLDKYIEQRGKLEEKEAVDIIIQLSDALKYAWEAKRIIHRNICPQIILLAKGNHPILTDLGMAKSQGSAQNLTMAGYTVGNPQYMSPEQVAANKELDFHADMYCLGLVFYEMLAGRPAFRDKSQVMLMNAQASKQPPNLKDENSKVSDSCVKVIGAMIEKDRNSRFVSWDELIKNLKCLLEPEKLKTAPQDGKAKKAPKKAEPDLADKKIKEFVRLLAEEKKRKLKRNIAIAFILVNIAILYFGAKYILQKINKSGIHKAVPAEQHGQ